MKFYRVIKENFLWEVGAILKPNDTNKGYLPIEDIWNKVIGQTEYITTVIVENQPEYFERVYENKFDKMLYVTAEELKKLYNKMKP